MKEYADPVIDWLDAGRGILSHRFFREVRVNKTGLLTMLTVYISIVSNYRTAPIRKTYLY